MSYEFSDHYGYGQHLNTAALRMRRVRIAGHEDGRYFAVLDDGTTIESCRGLSRRERRREFLQLLDYAAVAQRPEAVVATIDRGRRFCS